MEKLRRFDLSIVSAMLLAIIVALAIPFVGQSSAASSQFLVQQTTASVAVAGLSTAKMLNANVAKDSGCNGSGSAASHPCQAACSAASCGDLVSQNSSVPAGLSPVAAVFQLLAERFPPLVVLDGLMRPPMAAFA